MAIDSPSPPSRPKQIQDQNIFPFLSNFISYDLRFKEWHAPIHDGALDWTPGRYLHGGP